MKNKTRTLFLQANIYELNEVSIDPSKSDKRKILLCWIGAWLSGILLLWAIYTMFIKKTVAENGQEIMLIFAKSWSWNTQQGNSVVQWDIRNCFTEDGEQVSIFRLPFDGSTDLDTINYNAREYKFSNRNFYDMNIDGESSNLMNVPAFEHRFWYTH